jgi:hypothetical protein
MDYAKQLLAHSFPLFAHMLKERDDIWVPYHAWAETADARYVKQFQRYFSIAYPNQFKALFDGRTYTAKDMERVEAEYFKELRKANAENEKAFKDTLRLFFPAKKTRRNFPA